MRRDVVEIEGAAGGTLETKIQLGSIGRSEVQRASIDAERNGTGLCDELITQQGVSEKQVYRGIAHFLNVEYCEDLEPSQIFVSSENSEQFIKVRQALILNPGGRSILYVAPTHEQIGHIHKFLASDPTLRERIRICPPSILKEVLRKRFEDELISKASATLPDDLSARSVLDGRQIFIFSTLFYIFVGVLLVFPFETTFSVHTILTLIFFGCCLIRIFAACAGKKLRFKELRPYQERDLPIYTILVPLYRESEVVGQLVASLENLRWPKSKLDIKLVCEQDDHETIDVVRSLDLPAQYEVILVPPVGPRTKPKALNYALKFARGSFITIYDAEDRPHEEQLLEAWQSFQYGPSSLACVQSPLVIANYRKNLLTRMFAFEYAALFRAVLPWFGAHRLVIPLGGTSNHFRLEYLAELGAWDAFNVTEDADLGLRLARFGYTVDVISRPTFEDAPESFPIWKNQRTRWIKGWMQTWLVHLRHPVQAWREMGTQQFLVNQVYVGSILLSALLHPLLLLLIPILIANLMTIGHSDSAVWLLVLDMTNIMLAYLSFYILGLRTMEKAELKGYSYILAIPLYWMLISLAAWRALWQLVRNPHYWDKTPHQPFQEA